MHEDCFRTNETRAAAAGAFDHGVSMLQSLNQGWFVIEITIHELCNQGVSPQEASRASSAASLSFECTSSQET